MRHTRHSGAALLITILWGAAIGALGQTSDGRRLALIDGSGSMAGFFATGEIGRLQALLSPSSCRYFVDESVVSEPPSTVFGAHTFLNNALAQGINQQPAILWLVTDNQPSVGRASESDRDLDLFYEQLRSDKVKRICLFPLKLRFEGTLYTEHDGILTAGYRGRRGLLVYALLLDESSKNEFEEDVQRTEERFVQAFGPSSKCIRIKPLRRDTVTATLKSGKGLQPGEGGKIIGRDFDEGEPIHGHFVLELTSQMGQIALKESEIAVTKDGSFQTGDFSVDNIEPSINPRTIDLQPTDTKRFEVSLRVDPVHIKTNPKSLWNCLTRNRGVIHGYINVVIKVPKENLSVARDLATQVSTERDVYRDPSEATQSKIYRLDDLVKNMIPSEEIIQPRIGDGDGRIPVQLEVKYPAWPTLVFFGLLSAPLLLIGGTTIWVRRRPSYRLTWQGGKSRACPDFRLWPFAGKAIEIDRVTAAKMRLSPLSGIVVKAQRGYTVDDAASKPVRPDGSEFTVTRGADLQVVPFCLTTTGMSERLPKRVSGLEDDLSSYDGGGGSGGSEPAGLGDPIPPIRPVATSPRAPSASETRRNTTVLDDYDY